VGVERGRGRGQGGGLRDDGRCYGAFAAAAAFEVSGALAFLSPVSCSWWRRIDGMNSY